MRNRIAAVTLLVRDYDEAVRYFTTCLRFALLEDSDLGDGKRWVVVAPADSNGVSLLLAVPSTPAQEACIGHQLGGHVGFFLHTDDFARTYAEMLERGVRFRETARHEPYGTVAVFEDLYGNLWDLLEPRQR